MIFIVLFAFAPVFSQKQKADLVVLSANVRTMDAKKPRAEAFAVVGNKFAAIGSDRQIRAFIGAETKVIDAKGKLVLPGFNDSHVHFMGVGTQFFSVNLREARSMREVAEKIRFHAEFLPKGAWILGGGWNHENWTPNELPTKKMIDEAAPDHPVFVYHANPQTALVNGYALKLAGLDAPDKKISGGEILRDEKGAPTGIIKGAALAFVKRLTPASISENKLAVAEAATNYAASLGVTSVQDMHTDEMADVYRELRRRGKLKTRVYDCADLLGWQRRERRMAEKNGDEMIRTNCLKSFSDGEQETNTRLFTEILAGDKAGFQIMVHAVGADANDAILGIFERVAKTNGARDRRFRVEHAHNFRAPDLKRFAQSKIIASVQPFLFYAGNASAAPYRAMIEAGAPLAFGSDASMVELDPLYGIGTAVAGADDSSKNGLKKQALSVEEAVRLYTLGSAFAEFQENAKGSITAGKLADFVILSDDIFAINPVQIGQTKILTTVVDGKIVYQAKSKSDL